MYDRIYDYWKREKAKSNLQLIDKDFYEEFAEYIRQLKKYVEKTDEKTVKAKLAEAELERVQKLSKDLLEMRLRKILRIAESSSESETVSHAVIAEEMAIFENTLESSKQYQSMVQRILAGDGDIPAPSAPITRPRRVPVRFVAEIPAIVGVDLRSYGPFKPEDVAMLPLENAEILVKGKAALRIGCE
jgi:DNA replication initiation complex subunit (GINS family)